MGVNCLHKHDSNLMSLNAKYICYYKRIFYMCKKRSCAQKSICKKYIFLFIGPIFFATSNFPCFSSDTSIF